MRNATSSAPSLYLFLASISDTSARSGSWTIPNLHSELCNQVVFRVCAKTRALRNFDSTVDYRHGPGKRRRAEIRKHPLERRNFLLCRHAMQHGQKSRSQIKSIRYAQGARLLDLGGYFCHRGDAQLDHGGLNVIGFADRDHSAKITQAG